MLELGLSRTLLAPILEQYGAQLVLNGHEHSYQRTLPLRDGVPVEPASGTVSRHRTQSGELDEVPIALRIFPDGALDFTVPPWHAQLSPIFFCISSSVMPLVSG